MSGALDCRPGQRPAVRPHSPPDKHVTTTGNQPITDASAARRLLELPQEKAGNIMPHGVFFPGAIYTFVDSEAPCVGRMSSGLARGEALILNHQEPPDDGTGLARRLRFHPVGSNFVPGAKSGATASS